MDRKRTYKEVFNSKENNSIVLDRKLLNERRLAIFCGSFNKVFWFPVVLLLISSVLRSSRIIVSWEKYTVNNLCTFEITFSSSLICNMTATVFFINRANLIWLTVCNLVGVRSRLWVERCSVCCSGNECTVAGARCRLLAHLYHSPASSRPAQRWNG